MCVNSYDRVFASLSEELKGGSADQVVPGWPDNDLEDNVDLTSLFG